MALRLQLEVPMMQNTRAALYAITLALLGAACGSSTPATSTGDAGVDAEPPNPSQPYACGACALEGACCTQSVADGFGPEGFRCTAGTWKSDSACVPPPPPCTSPLMGSLKRADGTTVSPTCFLQLGSNGIVGAQVVVEPGGRLELHFDRLPAAGDVVPVIPYKERLSHSLDAGSPDAGANASALRIGRPGGFSGFDVAGESASGTVTITSIQSDASGITALHATLDVTVASTNPTSPWIGALTGSW